MNRDALVTLLDAVRTGSVAVASAVEQLRDLPFAELGDATLDTHRALRCGVPEVVFGERKSDDQLRRIVERLLATDDDVIITRLTRERAEQLLAAFPGHVGEHHVEARIVAFRRGVQIRRGVGCVAVVTGGTADVPVAEEAAVTAELLGNDVQRIYDVGVAGLHRLLARLPDLRRANVLIAVAGMEAALASVVAGLVDRPVIAVPTSVGYGANLGGVAALLAMVNSCAAGVTVVNIDNGFGAGYAASAINRRVEPA